MRAGVFGYYEMVMSGMKGLFGICFSIYDSDFMRKYIIAVIFLWKIIMGY